MLFTIVAEPPLYYEMQAQLAYNLTSLGGFQGCNYTCLNFELVLTGFKFFQIIHVYLLFTKFKVGNFIWLKLEPKGVNRNELQSFGVEAPRF